jgi:hypothetical protein
VVGSLRCLDLLWGHGRAVPDEQGVVEGDADLRVLDPRPGTHSIRVLVVLAEQVPGLLVDPHPQRPDLTAGRFQLHRPTVASLETLSDYLSHGSGEVFP